MKNSRVALVLMSVVLLVILAVSPVVPGLAAELELGAVDGLHGQMAGPACGGGSGG